VTADAGGLRWLYHVVLRDVWERERAAEAYRPSGDFLHASYRDAVLESARLYFPVGSARVILRIDPRRLTARVLVAPTPRGPMPHIHGAVAPDAIAEVHEEDARSIAAAPDVVTGTRFGFVAFAGMTLLDLVGPLDAVSRIASMGFDRTSTCAVIAANEEVWRGSEAELRTLRVRPPLDELDVLVVPGGAGARALVEDRAVVDWIASFSPHRLVASVCTGALLLGAAGRLRGRRATTHASALDLLAGYGATPLRARVVDEGQLLTAAGVTSGIDLGLHLVRRFAGVSAAARIAKQMEWA
jgi:cyclohexyl-isocyanide hydratase